MQQWVASAKQVHRGLCLGIEDGVDGGETASSAADGCQAKSALAIQQPIVSTGSQASSSTAGLSAKEAKAAQAKQAERQAGLKRLFGSKAIVG